VTARRALIEHVFDALKAELGHVDHLAHIVVCQVSPRAGGCAGSALVALAKRLSAHHLDRFCDLKHYLFRHSQISLQFGAIEPGKIVTSQKSGVSVMNHDSVVKKMRNILQYQGK
jgi:hypothetical protein